MKIITRRLVIDTVIAIILIVTITGTVFAANENPEKGNQGKLQEKNTENHIASSVDELPDFLDVDLSDELTCQIGNDHKDQTPSRHIVSCDAQDQEGPSRSAGHCHERAKHLDDRDNGRRMRGL